MDIIRRQARAWLRTCSRWEFERVVYAARLTDQQREVIDLVFNRGLSIVATALRCHLDASTVKRILATSYDKIYKVI